MVWGFLLFFTTRKSGKHRWLWLEGRIQGQVCYGPKMRKSPDIARVSFPVCNMDKLVPAESVRVNEMP